MKSTDIIYTIENSEVTETTVGSFLSEKMIQFTTRKGWESKFDIVQKEDYKSDMQEITIYQIIERTNHCTWVLFETEDEAAADEYFCEWALNYGLNDDNSSNYFFTKEEADDSLKSE